MKSCLLIIPKHFYSFERHLREALAGKGYSVTVSNDEYPEGTFGRLLGKLQIPLVFSISYRILHKRFLKNQKYDVALIFKGRGISARLIREMHRSVDKVVGYNWDSFWLNKSPLKWLKLVGKYYTFDYRDADRWSLPVIELFSAFAGMTESKHIRYELSVVMRNHSRRLAYVDNVVSVLRPATVFIFIYEMNILSFALNVLKNPLLYFRYRRHIFFRPLGDAEYSEVLRASKFTIDYVHDTQTGITMRCFEAICARTKIITNNSHMWRSGNFDPSDYIVFAGNGAPEGLIAFYNAAGTKSFSSKPRTISEFVDELLAG